MIRNVGSKTGKSPGQRVPSPSGNASGTFSHDAVPRSSLPMGRNGGGNRESGPKNKTEQPWLADRIAAGRRRAQSTACPHCGNHVLAGPDDDVAALPAVVDPEPVDAATELRARINHRASFNLIGGELTYRTMRWHVRHAPAGISPYPVHVEHVCDPGSSR